MLLGSTVKDRQRVFDETIDRLIEAALDALHHDRDHGSDVDKYEREVLRRKFTEILSD